MAEAFARRRLEACGSHVTVSSSGLMPPGRPAPSEVVDVMGARGIDVTDHRSRTFDADVIAAADLILGMERHHLTELVAISPDAYTRCFTLREFSRRLLGLGLGADDATDLGGILDMIAQSRGRRDVLRVGVADEIPDPMGRSPKVFERTAEEICALVDLVIDGEWPAPAAAAVGAD